MGPDDPTNGNGEQFTVTGESYPPEGGTAFGYKDRKYDFWFYVDAKRHPAGQALVITRGRLNQH
jgi:hypothetical protein